MLPTSNASMPLFADESTVTVRILPDRSVADFFVQGGRWSGTVAWVSKSPRKAANSQVWHWYDAVRCGTTC